MPPSVGAKSVQEEVEHAPSNLQLQSSVVQCSYAKSRYVAPSVMVHEDILNENIDRLTDPNVIEKNMQQRPRENECHKAKLWASENRSELCESTKCNIESIHSESERYTPHTKREQSCKTSEDDFSNTLNPTSSVVFQSVQVCKEVDKEMFARHTIPLDEESGKIASAQNQFAAATSTNHEDGGGKSLEEPSIVYTQSSKLKGNKNFVDLNLQGKMISNHDNTFPHVDMTAEIWKLIIILVSITLVVF